MPPARPNFLQSSARPWLMAPDNFTPPARTPWGGRRIAAQYKAGLALPAWDGQSVVGESWELSVTPELPGRIDDGRPLADVLGADAEAYLGREARLGRRATALLVKWLDADDNLSVQIHPSDDYPALAPTECGKPECWYVVDHEPGAGIYLGLSAGVSAAQLRAGLEAGADISPLLRFTEVQRGDLYCLEPGTPHALGRGVVLLEPQFVAPGKQGLTYRYWDWNRRYDASGRQDPAGKPRELHLAHALAVTRFAEASDPAWLDAHRCRVGVADSTGTATLQLLAGPAGDAAVLDRHLCIARLSGSGQLALPDWDALIGLTVVSGSVRVGEGTDCLEVRAGRTAVIPAAWGGAPLELHGAHALLSAAAA
jgi:mannose-6-phosphate isomerase class I